MHYRVYNFNYSLPENCERLQSAISTWLDEQRKNLKKEAEEDSKREEQGLPAPQISP